jgi:putative addiction module component (TIGR02574 family)
MMKTQELLDQIVDLPVDQRAQLASEILQTLNRPDPEIEKEWVKEARRRLKDFESGHIDAIPGEQVHRELRQKYTK